MIPTGIQLEALSTWTALPPGVALIALGANLGAREKTLEAAIRALGEHANCRLVACSSWHTTAPLGGPAGQGPFLNGVALVATELEPEELLALLHSIETEHGRERREHHGARTLDLDLLLFGAEHRSGPGLLLPHPRMHQRAFVLAPLVELCPALQLTSAGAATVAERLRCLDGAQSNE